MAIRGLDTAASGMFAYSDEIAVIGNNLANLNTNAFKANDVRFQDVLYEHFLVAGKDDIGGPTGLGVQYGRGVNIASIPTLFKQGPFKPGLDLDIAISGPGFFRVRDAGGNVFYTRLGAFQPKGAGASGLVNLQIGGRSLTLDPPVTLPGNNGFVSVSPEGILKQGTFTTQLSLYSVQNPDGLEQVGDLLFRETAASGAITQGNPGIPGFGTLVSNALEGSNVELSDELVELIQSSQAFALNSQSFVTGNEEIRTAIALIQQV